MVPVHHLSLHAVRPVQRAGSLCHVTFEHALPDEGGGPGHLPRIAVLDERAHLHGQGLDHEAVCRPERGQQADIARGPMPEPKAVADHDAGRVQAPHQNAIDELRRRPGRQLGRERQDQDRVDPRLVQQGDPMVQRRQHPGLGVGADDSAGVRVERDSDDLDRRLMGQVTGGLHDGPVSPMHTVEDADADHRGAPVGRDGVDPVEPLDALHRVTLPEVTGVPHPPVKPTTTLSTSPRGSINASTAPSASKTPVNPLSPAVASGRP